MITEAIKRFAEGVGHAYVATSDANGNPHLAAGRGLTSSAPDMIVFESWFCLTTLRNLNENPRIAVVVADPATGSGYQFTGRLQAAEETAMLDGYLPGSEPPGTPQVQWRLAVKVESVMAFSAEAHSDRPLG